MIIHDEDDEVTPREEAIETYAALYASYIMVVAYTGYDLAKLMLRVLPSGAKYHAITELSPEKLKLTIDKHEIIIPISWDNKAVVTVLIDDLPCVAWSDDDVYFFLLEHDVYPEDDNILTLEYLADWCKYIKDTYIFFDPHSQCLAYELERWIE